jgi:hypothetical protein
VLEEVASALADAGLVVSAVVPSPLRGADGNVEFVAHARRDATPVSAAVLDAAIAHAPTEAA